METKYENQGSNHDDRVSEKAIASSNPEKADPHIEPISLEEIRRVARENWLRKRQESEAASGKPHSLEEEQRQVRENWLKVRQQATGAGVAPNRERAAGHDAKEDLGQAQDGD